MKEILPRLLENLRFLPRKGFRFHLLQRCIDGLECWKKELGKLAQKINPEGYPLTERNTPVVCEKGQPVFTPFFWLREEDDIEKSSTQQSYEDQLIGTPQDAPCFSDNNDSDDEASGAMVKYYNGKLVTDSQSDCKFKNMCTKTAQNGHLMYTLKETMSSTLKLNYLEVIELDAVAVELMVLPLNLKLSREEKYITKVSNVHQPNITSKRKSSTVIPWKFEKRLKNLVLCCSAITNVEKGVISEFQKWSGVTVLKNWNVSVTHVIASTDENGACRRTLKVLMGMLEGKWILSLECK